MEANQYYALMTCDEIRNYSQRRDLPCVEGGHATKSSDFPGKFRSMVREQIQGNGYGLERRPEVESWLTAKRGFREAAMRIMCIDRGIAASMHLAGIDQSTLTRQHSEAALKFHMATIHLLEVDPSTPPLQFIEPPVEEDPGTAGMTPDVALARMSALKLNEQRLTLELEAISIMLLCIQAEIARLDRISGTNANVEGVV
ncbi:hypothetical protein C8T65DRAFT_703283 [Cerioporus squamosus]|nr:hypothetical protein C8T65DRAFT_703283 [Cerioporus squamosus]